MAFLISFIVSTTIVSWFYFNTGGYSGALQPITGKQTTWANSIPVFTTMDQANRIEGKKIRDRFLDPDNELSSKTKDDKMISLDIISGDLGSEEYLKKDTIKDSISELSNLSKAKYILREKLASCEGIKEGPKLFFPVCKGDMVVITISGSMKMSCDEVEKSLFYGPVTLKSLHCQQSFLFEADCNKKLALKIQSDDCKEESYKTLFHVTIAIFLMTSLVLMLLIVWLIGTAKGVLINGRYIQMKREGCHYTAHYNEYYDGKGIKRIIALDDPPMINMETKKFRRHWCKILLLLICCRPLKIEAYTLLEHYDSAVLKYNYKLTMTDSENINFGESTIAREMVVHTSNLMHMFNTSSWKLDTKEEYFCQWYKCDAISTCGMGILPFIRINAAGQDVLKFNNVNNSYITCQKIRGHCFFGPGCKIIGFEIITESTDLFSVYSISLGGSHGGHITPPKGCVVDNVLDLSSGLLGNFLLLYKTKNEAYLCHHDLFSTKPELGMLGDLQITDDNKLHFSTNNIICSADTGDHALCRYGTPFMDNLANLCERVSNVPFQVDIDIKAKLISWKLSGDATITLKCDRQLPLANSNNTCREVDIKVWEVAHPEAQLLMSFKAISEDSRATFRFPSMVHLKSHEFRCNGEYQFTELYDVVSLTKMGLNFTRDIIPYNTIDNLQEDHFSGKDISSDYGSNFLDKLFSNWPTLGLSANMIILLAVIAVLILRK